MKKIYLVILLFLVCGVRTTAQTLSGSTACTGSVLTVTSSMQPTQIVWQLGGVGIRTVTPTIAATGITVAGGNGDGSGATQLGLAYSVFVDGNSNIYVGDGVNNRVQKWVPGATSGTTVAGTGTAGNGANQLYYPFGVYIDGSGNIYIADESNARIQKWAPGATIGVTVAGTGSAGIGANQLSYPEGVFVDGSGNIYIADEGNNRIQEWAAGATSGITVAGTGTTGNGESQLYGPTSVCVDGSGNIYIADKNNSRIQKWTAGATSGITVAGTGIAGSSANQLNGPTGLYVDGSGNIYVADFNNNRIQKWAAGATSGITIAGTGTEGSGATQLSYPFGVYVDGSDNIYVADFANNRIQEFAASITTTLTAATAGSYTALVATALGSVSTNTVSVNVMPAAITGPAVIFNTGPISLSDISTGGIWSSASAGIVTVSSTGIVTGISTGTSTISYTLPGGCATTLILSDYALSLSGSTACTGSALTVTSSIQPMQIIWELGGTGISTVTPTYTIAPTTVAGVDASAPTQLSFPTGVCLDGSGNIYVADQDNNRIQKWAVGATAGITVAGTGVDGNGANQLSYPEDVYVDAGGNIYIADGGYRVQKWAPGATAGTTVAGNGTPGTGANQLTLSYGVFVDGSGNVYVADEQNNRIQKWAPGATTGVTVAGQSNGTGGSGANQLSTPIGLFVDGSGNVYVADAGNSRVQKWPAGATSGTTVAGTGTYGSSATQLGGPTGVYIDGGGNIYVADAGNSRVQKWAPGATAGITIAGTGTQGGSATQLNSPYRIYVDGSGNVYVADASNNRIQKWAAGATTGITVAGVDRIDPTQLSSPQGAYVDGSGNIYVSDQVNNRVQKWAPGATAGITVAGQSDGTYGSGASQLWSPTGIWVDGTGNIYVSDNAARVQKWAPGATAGTTVAGSSVGTRGSSASQLSYPNGIYVDGSSNVYVADGSNARVEKWAPGATAGTIVAGTGVSGTGANELYTPTGLYIDDTGNIYVTDANRTRIQKWVPGATTGITVASSPYNTIEAVYVDKYGNVYTGGLNSIQKWAPAATAGVTITNNTGYPISTVTGIFMDGSGNLYVTDGGNNRILEFAPSITTSLTATSPGNYSALVSSLAGSGTTNSVSVNATPVVAVSPNVAIYSGTSTSLTTSGATTYNWLPATGLSVATGASVTANPTATTIYSITGTSLGCSSVAMVTVSVDALPALSESTSCPGSILTVASSQTEAIVWQLNGISVDTATYTYAATGTTVAGTGAHGNNPNQLSSPSGVFVDSNGNLYVADALNNRIQKWVRGATTGITVAGQSNGISGSGATQLNSPNGIYIDGSGNVYVADGGNNRIQKWASGATSGITVAGQSNGIAGSAAYQLSAPADVYVDGSGNIYVADQVNNRIQEWTVSATTGVTVAGGGSSLASELSFPWSVYVDGSGNIYVADAGNNRVEKWAPGATAGIIVAGTGGGYSCLAIQTGTPQGVYVDGIGNIYVAEWGCNRVQKWAPGATIGTIVAGMGGGGNGATQLNEPCGLCADGSGNIYVADFGNNRVQMFAASIITTITATTGGNYTAITTTTAGIVTTNVVTVDPGPNAGTITGMATICTGSTIILSDVATGGVWSSSATGIATAGSTGIVTGVATGTVTISYSVTNSCGTAIAIYAVTVNPSPAAITGPSIVCQGLTAPLSDATTGGTWSSSNTSIVTIGSTHIVTGIATGTATISYILPTGCAAVDVVIVNTPVVAGTAITCAGSTIILSDASGGTGTWASSSTAIATAGSTTGIITGVAAGTANITYTNSSGCKKNTIITVDALPAAISGTASVCTGLTTTLTDATTGGTWSALNTNASVGTGAGIVTGGTAGTDVITYTLPTGCIKTTTVTVNQTPAAISGNSGLVCAGLMMPLANAITGGTWMSSATTVATVATTGIVTGVANGTATISYTLGSCRATVVVTAGALPAVISGTASVCTGLTTTLTDATTGGTWSASNANASVGTGAGIVTGGTAGTDVITYTLPTGCIKTAIVTVNQTPAAISGNSGLVCASSTMALADGITGGTWMSSTATVATVATTGIVTGVANGTTTISYTLGSCRATTVVTAGALPAAISGTASVCTGLSTTLTDATTGGTWSATSSNASIGTTSSGVTYGVNAGTAVVTYMLTTGCIKIATVTVNQTPAAISGNSGLVCAGLTMPLADAITGGTWMSSAVTVATVATTGIVTGVANGTSTISYTLGSCRATTVITAGALPAAIAGATSVCQYSSFVLSDATAGGAWSASNANASVGTGTGIVTGVTAGTDIITYTLPTGCVRTTTVTVNTEPGPIMGVASVCPGISTTLSDFTAGGTWASSSTAVATVSTTGVVTGVAAGTVFISYHAGSCSNVLVFTVNPNLAVIAGAASVCAGSTIALSDASVGGTWSSSNTAIGTVDAFGNVYAQATGTTQITYTIATGCYKTSNVTVNPLPIPITGNFDVCTASTTALADATTGTVTWASSNTTIATVSATGVVTGESIGTAAITYKLSGTGCWMETVVTVNPIPTAITGAYPLCPGSSLSLSDALGAGTWSSSNVAIATVGTDGTVSGIMSGTAIVTYAASTTGCKVLTVVTVDPTPPILGSTSVCAGSVTSLSDATAGGAWSTVGSEIATVGSTGIVATISAGTVTVIYTFPNGCMVTATVTVNQSPASIPGGAVCIGLSTVLSEGITGGTWMSSSTATANVTSTGIVTGVVAGTATISYTLGNCRATAIITVDALPAAISGTATVCQGSIITLSDATAGGTWSNTTGNASVAGSAGIITGVTAGTDIITYTLPTGCTRTITVTVNSLPFAIEGMASVCAGTTTTLSDITAGGTWASSSTAVATVSTTGVVTGVVAGTVFISYHVGSCSNVLVFTVNANPAAIAGAASICQYPTLVLSDATAGGIWSGNNANVSIDGSGDIMGITAGSTIITYQLPTGCYKTLNVTVNPNPSAIYGYAAPCSGATTVLSDMITGGTWASGTTSVATVSATGIVSGLTAGTSNITYTLHTGCWTLVQITVNPLPSAISGAYPLCPGSSLSLSDAWGAGMWRSSNVAIATVGTDGTLNSIAAGTATITYSSDTYTSSGSVYCSVTARVTVNPLPAAIAGYDSVCVGSTTSLSDATAGGAWSSTNFSIASIGSTGIVAGVAAGTVIITYTLPSSCYQTTWVYSLSQPAPITGDNSVCIGSTIPLNDVTTPGAWASSATAKATISAAGVVTGVAAGTATISYTHTGPYSGGCKTTVVITVDALPVVTVINGPAAISFSYGPVTLSDATTGGTWSSSNTAVITVGTSTGTTTTATAVSSSGSATISYTVTNAAGCMATVTKTMSTTSAPPPHGGTTASPQPSPGERELSVYPNPTMGSLTVKAEIEGVFYLYTMEGKQFGEYKITVGGTLINLPNGLAAGIYMGKYKGEDGSVQDVKLVYQP